MVQLNNTIRFWEDKLGNKGLFDVSTTTLIELTIKYLKVLKETGYTDPNDR
ncbi:hypothetical protein LCGC14_2312520 [marine sediment metagenome]|uniref:Uncharacterized protein n=1 Tax=marine sediment metagenome TaxID=412755 RepID=A0A0F9D7S2_9ZZZZ